MMKLGDNEYKMHKYLAQKVIDDLRVFCDFIDKVCIKQLTKLSKLKSQISSCEDVEQINNLSAEIDKESVNFVNNLAIKSTLDAIINKNQERISYLTSIFKTSGIYDEKPNKKDLKLQMQKINEVKLDENAEFVNPKLQGSYFLFRSGNLFEIVDGKLDFSTQHNKTLLETDFDMALNFAFEFDAEAVLTIPIDLLLNSPLKKKLLTKITFYIFDKISNSSLVEINKKLGNILNLSLSVPSSIKSYIVEVENALNVKILNRLIELFPDKIDQINKIFHVDKNSKYIS